MSRIQLSMGWLAVTLVAVVGEAAADQSSARSATAPSPPTFFVCSGTFSSGSGIAGSSTEKDGKPTCFFEADSAAESRAQKECGQNAVCDIAATTYMKGSNRIVEKVLAVTRLGGPVDHEPARVASDKAPLLDPSACPASELGAFVKAFSGRISIQARFTRWPLAVTHIDAAARPEPKPVTKQVTEQKVSYPLMMDVERARREGKVVRITQDGKTTGHVEYAGSDNGQKVRYLFQRSGSCWQLVAIDDQSL
ncbi:hypothetical protein [Burkholderia cenocepacia]|uniref:hypothetical protein n=2 Tax=Bacteria TaxID=2 RepID=UPI00196B0399|nr:hypothetical protein [Burkholderia cenocepacia]MBN3507137.1 hypothetical protein [Burkholderia cenocepacia]MBR8408030.1 hypothetical protein [Burkholderia cenocepacia]MCO1394690.1 hypothetical protein [Burkholderia cenocepacia]MCO1407394.1 hypothetical protein [Burkholderia cenocepacia]MDI9701119.1 hypothetical protein [Burkholderia cenocepacia]